MSFCYGELDFIYLDFIYGDDAIREQSNRLTREWVRLQQDRKEYHALLKHLGWSVNEAYYSAGVRAYREHVFRWLASQRDYPYYIAPLPHTDLPMMLAERIREECTREFNR